MPVYQKRGKFYCVYLDGKRRVWEPFGNGPQAKAQAEARDLEIKLQKKRGQFRETPKQGINFQELAQLYLDHRQTDLAERTRQDIMFALTKYALPLIGLKPITGVNMEDWQRIQARMIEAGLKNRTINKIFAYVSKIFSWAVDENDHLLEDHPWRKRTRLKVREKFKVDLLSIEEFKSIRAAAEPHLAWAMEVAYYTGVRPGLTELFQLKWSDVDWPANRIQIYSPKTDAYHLQYLPPDFMARMFGQFQDSRAQYPDCDYIVSYQGRPVRSLKTAWRTALAKAGVTRRVRLYDIRHFYITYALASGAPITELAERVGHASTQMIVNVYAHLAKDLQTNQAFDLPDIYED